MNGHLDDFRLSEPDRLPPLEPGKRAHYLANWVPTEGETLPPTIIARVDAVTGIRIDPPIADADYDRRYTAAIMHALREYEEGKVPMRAFSHQDVDRFKQAMAARMMGS